MSLDKAAALRVLVDDMDAIRQRAIALLADAQGQEFAFISQVLAATSGQRYNAMELLVAVEQELNFEDLTVPQKE